VDQYHDENENVSKERIYCCYASYHSIAKIIWKALECSTRPKMAQVNYCKERGEFIMEISGDNFSRVDPLARAQHD
jgi:hypothetical protein